MRARSVPVVALSLLITAACGSSAPADPDVPPRPAVQFGELTVDGQTRRYRVYAPPTAGRDRPAPLLIALHDADSNAETFRATTGFDEAAAAGDFVVVYPESLFGIWNAGWCCGPARSSAQNIDDLGFVDGLLDRLLNELPLDPERVYVAGASNGGILAYRLACERADRLAGVAAVGGTMVMDQCAPARPTPVLALHGTEDGHVPYDGGPTTGAPDPAPSQPELAQTWAQLNACSDSPDRVTEGAVTTVTWPGCARDASVRLVTVEQGGHTWFSPDLGDVAGAVDATAAIVAFFRLDRGASS